MDFTVSEAATWLTVAPGSGTAPETLVVSVAQGALEPGSYFADITVTAPGAEGSPKVIPVSFYITELTTDFIDVPTDATYDPDAGDILVWDGGDFRDGTLA